MIKSAIALAAAAPLHGSTCPCRSLRQHRSNAGWTGDDYTGAYDRCPRRLRRRRSWRCFLLCSSGCSAIVAADGVDTETQFSGKAGLGIPVSDALGVYGEVSFLTAEDEDDFGVGEVNWV